VAESDGETGSVISVEFFQNLIDEDVMAMKSSGLSLHNVLIISDETQVSFGSIWKNTDSPSYTYPKAKVLIADDMQVNRDIFSEITRPWKFELQTAKDGQEAVKLAIGNQFDLIVLDQMMPVMTGTEAADEIKKFSKAPKVLLTANITDTMRKESKEHGFDAFMKKPIDQTQLKEIIESLLPEALREAVDSNESENLVHNRAVLGYEKALSSYISEMKELVEVLPEYAKSDMGMFRNKVHGIKGVSRQLGKENIALSAEILEMAANLDNQSFIDEFFDTFYGDLQYIISDSERELEILLEQNATETETILKKREATSEEIEALFKELKAALEQYDMTEIDDCLEKLDQIVLSRKMGALLKEIKDLYEDVEYDDALELVNQILDQMKINSTEITEE